MANSLIIEQFKNGALSSLTAPIGLTDATIGVLNPTAFPAFPQFRLLVDSEYMLATLVNPAPTVAPVCTDGGANADPLHAGVFNVTYTYVMAGGESTQSPNGAVTLATTGNKINVAQISGVPSYVTACKFYFNGAVPAGDTNGFVVSQVVSVGVVSAFSIIIEGNATPAPATMGIFVVSRGQETSIATTHLGSASVISPLTAGALQNFATTKLDEFILLAAAASITFSSIPQTYRHLELIFTVRGDNAVNNDDVFLRLNGDAGTNYDGERLLNGVATPFTAQTQMVLAYAPGTSAPAAYFAHGRLLLPNYTSVLQNKEARTSSTLAIATNTNYVVDSQFSWRTTNAAITSLTLLLNAGNLAIGSSFSLYGIP